MRGVAPFLGQCDVIIVLGHRARGLMRALISPLKDIINVFLNGQLVPRETEFLDFLLDTKSSLPSFPSAHRKCVDASSSRRARKT